jgi:TRAP-type C4-dicarboxylate transport system substrate-binding protein
MDGRRIFSILGVAIFVGFLATNSFAVEKFKWRAQVLTPLNSYMGKVYWGTWTDLVRERTKGVVDIELFPPGAIAKGKEIYGAVQSGAVEVGCGYGAYHSTEIPAAYAEYSLPMAFKSFDELYDFYYNFKNGAVLKTLDKYYRQQGTTILSVAGFTVGFMTKFPIEKIADLKGKKLRASGPYAALAQNLGASPVLIASPEQYMALQRGTIDGTLNPLYMAETYKLKEVIKYIILPPVGYGMGETYVNLEAWNKLPDDLKKIVKQASIDAALKHYKPKYDELEGRDIKESEKAGVKVIHMSPEELSKIRKAAEPVWEEVAEKSSGCKEVIDLMKEFIKK